MNKKMIVALLTATQLVSGCIDDPESPENKRIYSVLQYQELELRHKNEHTSYVFSRGTLGAEYNTIAFPLSEEKGSYMVFHANPEEGRRILSVPDDRHKFYLTEQTLGELVERGLITEPLQKYLVEHAI